MNGARETLDVYLAEYNDLRAEIHQRVNNQLLILGGELALVTAFLPVLRPVIEAGTPLPLLLAPILFAIVAWLYHEQDLFIVNTARYIEQCLRPAVTALIDREPPPPQLLGWERYREKYLFRAKPGLLHLSTVFRLAATLGPGFVSLAVGVYHTAAADELDAVWMWLHWVLGGVALGLLVGDCLLALHCMAGYRDIVDNENDGQYAVPAPDSPAAKKAGEPRQD